MSELLDDAINRAITEYDVKINKYTKEDIGKFQKEFEISNGQLATILKCSYPKISFMKNGTRRIDPKLIYVMDKLQINLKTNWRNRNEYS